MKHAGADSLDRLAPLLAQLRDLAGLKEKQRGVFYFKSKAFLHFHQDGDGLFADLRTSADWQRYPVTTEADSQVLIDATRQALGRG
jgi:hypothetical protein